MKRNQRAQYVSICVFIGFLLMQGGVVFLLVAQSFNDIYQQVILTIGILLLIGGGIFLSGYLIWKHPT